jgi:prophage antirepressor-like protein
MNNQLTPFEGEKIRKAWLDEQWFFSVVDVIKILTDSSNANDYWYRLKKRENELSTICRKLKIKSDDGKMYSTDCANTEGVFRILMSVPSPKAEPFKLWLVSLGKQAINSTQLSPPQYKHQNLASKRFVFPLFVQKTLNQPTFLRYVDRIVFIFKKRLIFAL